MKQFTNPYLKEVPAFNGPGKNLYRAPASIDKDDYEFIRGLRPRTGTTIIVQNLLWQKLTQTLKSHGITNITHQQSFEDFVANCTITDGRLGGSGTPVGGNAAEDNKRNVGRGATRPRSAFKKSANQQPVATS